MDDQTLVRVRVWDGWVRLVHWSIVLLIGLSWWSIETGRMRIHYLSGYAVLTLVLFRIGWGFVGSDTARFGRFLRSPVVALRHLLHFRRPEPDREIGHNAAGGWMVLVLLALLLAQPLTGLFADSGYGCAAWETDTRGSAPALSWTALAGSAVRWRGPSATSPGGAGVSAAAS